MGLELYMCVAVRCIEDGAPDNYLQLFTTEGMVLYMFCVVVVVGENSAKKPAKIVPPKN